MKFNQFKQEACEPFAAYQSQQTLNLFLDTDFLAMGPNNYSWNVVRCTQSALYV